MIGKQHLCLPDSEARAGARSFIRGIIEVAAKLGAPAIIGSMQGKWGEGVSREQALEWLADALNDLGEHAANLGQPLLCEPLNRYETNLFNRVDETVAFLKTLGTGNVKILADLFHMTQNCAMEGRTAFRRGRRVPVPFRLPNHGFQRIGALN